MLEPNCEVEGTELILLRVLNADPLNRVQDEHNVTIVLTHISDNTRWRRQRVNLHGSCSRSRAEHVRLSTACLRSCKPTVSPNSRMRQHANKHAAQQQSSQRNGRAQSPYHLASIRTI